MTKMRNLSSPFSFSIVFAILFSWHASAVACSKDASGASPATLVTKEQRRTLVSTDSGEISAVEICDATGRLYHLQFITLDPNSLFLPVLLHANMVFYVHTGSGSLSGVSDDGRDEIQVKRGDVYSLQAGSVFFVRSSLDPTRERLRIYAMFADSKDKNPYEPYIGAYSTISDLVLGFDDKILQSAFEVPREAIEEILNGTKTPRIVHITSRNETEQPERRDWRAGIIESLVGPEPEDHNKKKSTKAFNLFTAKHDFENCNGWSLVVKPKDLPGLRRSNVGAFMVNLTKGSMMGPHWNPRATEIAIVIEGKGMIQVVCPSSNRGSASEPECKNMRFGVGERDVFVVSRFHPMAQMAFNNDSFVFMGFSTMAAKNYPQFLAGKRSVFGTLDRDILAMAFNVPTTTIDRWLASKNEDVILECTSCAEEEEATMEEEIEKEEERKRKEEEEDARRREEEERKRKEEEEEEARRREEEAKKRAEEEERKRKEEAEEARRREEEARRKEARKREKEEEARRREEEEEEEEEEEKEEHWRRKEEARRKEARKTEEEEEEEEEARRREEEEEEARRREEEEEEEYRRREEEEEEEEYRRRRARQHKEQAPRREEEEEAESRWQERERRREEEEEEEEREEEDGWRPERERRHRWSKEEDGRRKEERQIRERVEGEGREVRIVSKKMWRM